MLEHARVRGRPLPHLVLASAWAELVDRPRTALGRRPPEDELLVDEDPGKLESVEVRRLPRVERLPVQERDNAPPELRCRLRIHAPQEVPDAVRLVLRHERRSVAGEAFP